MILALVPWLIVNVHQVREEILVLCLVEQIELRKNTGEVFADHVGEIWLVIHALICVIFLSVRKSQLNIIRIISIKWCPPFLPITTCNNPLVVMSKWVFDTMYPRLLLLSNW